MRFPTGLPLILRRVEFAGPLGRVKADLILDTGAVFTALGWQELRAIGYDPAVVPDRQVIITANGVIQVPKVTVESVRLGEAQATEVEVICHDIPEAGIVSGLLGLSFLKHFRTVIDYRNGYCEITEVQKELNNDR